MRTLVDMKRMLDEAKNALELPLTKVIEQYGSDEYLQSQLEPFMEQWGQKPFHEFLSHISSGDCLDQPDAFTSVSDSGDLFWIFEALR